MKPPISTGGIICLLLLLQGCRAAVTFPVCANTGPFSNLNGDNCQCDYDCIDCHGGRVIPVGTPSFFVGIS